MPPIVIGLLALFSLVPGVGEAQQTRGPRSALLGTVVSAVDVSELRAAIDAARALTGLAAFAWTDSTLVPGQSVIKAQHLIELRIALNEAYVARNSTTPTYSDTTIVPGQTTVKAIHLGEIQAAIAAFNALPTLFRGTIAVAAVNNSSMPIVAADTGGNLLGVLVEPGTLNVIGATYRSAELQAAVYLRPDHLPDRVVIGEHVFLFEHYTDSTVDVAVIRGNGKKYIHRSARRGGVAPLPTAAHASTGPTTASLPAPPWLVDSLTGAGLGIDVALCTIAGLEAFAYPGTIALNWQALAYSCGSFVVTAFTTLAPADDENLRRSETAVSLISTVAGCLGLFGNPERVDCWGALITSSTALLLTTEQKNATAIQQARGLIAIASPLPPIQPVPLPVPEAPPPDMRGTWAGMGSTPFTGTQPIWLRLAFQEQIGRGLSGRLIPITPPPGVEVEEFAANVSGLVLRSIVFGVTTYYGFHYDIDAYVRYTFDGHTVVWRWHGQGYGVLPPFLGDPFYGQGGLYSHPLQMPEPWLTDGFTQHPYPIMMIWDGDVDLTLTKVSSFFY